MTTETIQIAAAAFATLVGMAVIGRMIKSLGVPATGIIIALMAGIGYWGSTLAH
jgi:hypothetical protein